VRQRRQPQLQPAHAPLDAAPRAFPGAAAGLCGRRLGFIAVLTTSGFRPPPAPPPLPPPQPATPWLQEGFDPSVVTVGSCGKPPPPADASISSSAEGMMVIAMRPACIAQQRPRLPRLAAPPSRAPQSRGA